MEHDIELPSWLNPLPSKPALLEYYTHPLCDQSWAFEPHWHRLRGEFGHRFEWRYRLVGAAAAPACLAVKCAERQGPQAGELYLQALREAAMHHGRDLACPDELVTVAGALAAQVPTVFDAVAFRRDLAAEAGTPAFCQDLQQARRHQITQLPTLVLWRGREPSRTVVDEQPYEVLLQALARRAPDLFYVVSVVDGGAG